MKNVRRILSLLVAAVMILSLLSACGSSDSSTAAPGTSQSAASGSESSNDSKQADNTTSEAEPSGSSEAVPAGGKIYYTYASDAPNMSPTQNAFASYNTIAALYRYIPNEEGTASIVVPDLAAADPETEDGYTWKIAIDPNAKWANGEPINADTFIYSWQQVLDPHILYPNGSGAAKNYIEIKNAYAYYTQENTGVEVSWDDVGLKKVDDHTVSVTTEGKYSAYDVKLQFRMPYTAPIYEPIYEQCFNSDKTDNTYGTEIDLLMASGPYVLSSWTKGAERIFTANPNYLHADEIHLDGISSRIITDESTRLELFENGQLDYIELGTNGLAKYGDDPRIIPYQSFVVQGIEFNFENPAKPYLNSLNFRKAIFYGVDRESIASLNNGVPTNYFLAQTTGAYADGTNFGKIRDAAGYLEDNYSYDPELAKDYFDKALAETGTEKVSVTLIYTENNEGLRKASEYLQNSLQELFGKDRFEMSLTAMSSNARLELMRTAQNGPTDGWDMAWQGWDLAASTVYPNRKFEVYTSTDVRRVSNYNCKELDDLYAKSVSEESRLDEKLRAEISIDMEKVLLENVLQVPVWNTKAYYIFSDRMILRAPNRLTTYQFGDAYMDIAE